MVCAVEPKLTNAVPAQADAEAMSAMSADGHDFARLIESPLIHEITKRQCRRARAVKAALRRTGRWEVLGRSLPGEDSRRCSGTQRKGSANTTEEYSARCG